MPIEEISFVIFTFAEDSDAFTKTLEERFKERVKSLYNFMDAERGYIVIKPGTDDERQEPLMSLAVSTVEHPMP